MLDGNFNTKILTCVQKISNDTNDHATMICRLQKDDFTSFWYLPIHHHHIGVPRKLPSIHVVWCNRNHHFAFLLRPMADMYGEGPRKKMSLFQLAATITHSILESKILRCKVNFEIYFPKRKVMNKVSVKPWLLWKWTLSVKRSNGVQTQTLIYTFE